VAKAPPPEPIDHHYDIPRLTKVFAISSLAIMLATGLMIYEDHQGVVRLWNIVTFKEPFNWRHWQKEFRRNERERTIQLQQQAAEKIDPVAEQKLFDQKREGTKYLRQHRANLRKAEAAARRAEGRWYDADQIFRFAKAAMDTARYQYETVREHEPEASATRKKHERFLELEEDFHRKQTTEQAAKKEWDQALAQVAALEKSRKEAEDALKKIHEDYDRYLAKRKTLRNDTWFAVRNAPFADMLAPNLKIEQVQLDGLQNEMNFLKSQRVDRCMSCHIAADKRGFEDKEKYPSVLRTHPRLDLFVDSNSPHPYASFGCTSCHGGKDRATDFMRAGHMPNDYREFEELQHGNDPDVAWETEAGQWTKKYGWAVDKFLETPMYPMKAVEAGCFRCHKSEVNHPKAKSLDQGRKLIENLGCWGCHKMKGYEDLPKVGPALDRIAGKTSPEWVARWLSDPRAFRGNTKMPRFFYLDNFGTKEDRELTDTMIAGVVTYLFDKSKTGAIAVRTSNIQAGAASATGGMAQTGETNLQAAAASNVPALAAGMPNVRLGSGDAARGKALFESVGCQGCHVSDPEARRDVMTGWRQHGPNLIGLSDKTTPEWLALWLKNPKAWNPETRMPNLRLSDGEIADLVAFLMTKPASRPFRALNVPTPNPEKRDRIIQDYMELTKSVADAKADIARMSAHDKDLYVGEKIIGHYGCFACHSIPGFENAKQIGVELSDWGNKQVHLLDFGFVHLPHTRADWLEQKVRSPRSFDRDKVKTFQEKLKMPQFSLSEDEVRGVQTTVLGYLRDDMADSLRVRPTGEKASIEHGRRIAKEYNCQGCHVLEDKGGQIRETLTDVALAPPNIRGEGAKVQSDWLFAFVKAPKTGEIRPWLKVRMPTFEFSVDQLNALTAYFAALEKAKYPFEAKVDVLEARSRAAGERTFEALKCASCHPTSQQAAQDMLAGGKTPADLAPMLSAAHTRLRYDWIADWIKRPEEWMPGTRMPTNFPKLDEKTNARVSPLAAALDTEGFAGFKAQLVAIWGSEEEAKKFIGDPDRVTKALRDHIWSLGGGATDQGAEGAVPPGHLRRAAGPRPNASQKIASR